MASTKMVSISINTSMLKRRQSPIKLTNSLPANTGTTGTINVKTGVYTPTSTATTKKAPKMETLPKIIKAPRTSNSAQIAATPMRSNGGNNSAQVMSRNPVPGMRQL
jgi:hypothetical protein